MTRGPVPVVAIRQAIRNAAERGTIMDRNLIRESRTELILFCTWITVFVHIRRSPLLITDPADCAVKFKEDIYGFRRVPLTSVTARELWLLLPWDGWQYFRILDDRVIEIRADGVPLLSGGAEDPAPQSVKEKEPSKSPGPGVSPSGGDT